MLRAFFNEELALNTFRRNNIKVFASQRKLISLIRHPMERQITFVRQEEFWRKKIYERKKAPSVLRPRANNNHINDRLSSCQLICLSTFGMKGGGGTRALLQTLKMAIKSVQSARFAVLKIVCSVAISRGRQMRAAAEVTHTRSIK